MKLPQYHSHLRLDGFVVMPNHVHGILVLIDNVGAGLADTLLAKPTPMPKPAPTGVSPPTDRHGISEIIRGFKTFSARRINQMRKMQGVPVWQRNYYEHIIRNDGALQNIQQYIDNNPRSWQQDQLRPNRINP